MVDVQVVSRTIERITTGSWKHRYAFLFKKKGSVSTMLWRVSAVLIL
jgi:hypothetical protein